MAKAKKVGMTVEVTSDNYGQIKTYEFPDFTQEQVDTVKQFLYDVSYVGVRNIRIVE